MASADNLERARSLLASDVLGRYESLVDLGAAEAIGRALDEAEKRGQMAMVSVIENADKQHARIAELAKSADATTSIAARRTHQEIQMLAMFCRCMAITPGVFEFPLTEEKKYER